MAGALHIQFETFGDLGPRLHQAIASGEDLTPAMQSIAVHLESATRMRFEREKGPGDVPWKQSRRALEEGGQTLTMTGDLKSSIDSEWGRDFAAAGPERSFGAAIYAAIHQFGGEIVPRAKKALSFGGRIVSRVIIPARPYLGFDDYDRQRIIEIFTDFFGGLFGKGGTA